MSRVAIIDSGGANIGSVENALRRLGVDPEFTADPQRITAAERVILPGVGAAATAMRHLQRHGLVDCIRELSQPVLGICLGMQLLFDASSEGEVACLGVIPGRLERLPAAPGIRVPHMGWNAARLLREDPLVAGLSNPPWFYFVHSFYAPIGEDTIASSDHGIPFSAVVRRGNFCGVQFHPERSAADGAKLLQNFLEEPCN